MALSLGEHTHIILRTVKSRSRRPDGARGVLEERVYYCGDDVRYRVQKNISTVIISRIKDKYSTHRIVPVKR